MRIHSADRQASSVPQAAQRGMGENDEGFEVFAVVDASGTFNAPARDAAHKRMAAAGVQLINWFAVACELHRDWRNDVEGLGSLFAKHIPDYGNLITSHAAHT